MGGVSFRRFFLPPSDLQNRCQGKVSAVILGFEGTLRMEAARWGPEESSRGIDNLKE